MSWLNTTSHITIQDIISLVDWIEKPSYTEFNTTTTVALLVGQGSGMTVFVNHTNATSPVIENFDVLDDEEGVVMTNFLFRDKGINNFLNDHFL